MSDLISRQAAIDALLHHGELENDYTDLYHDGYCDGIYDSCDVLEDLPSAQPERKKGEWKAKEEREKQEIFICSECGGWAYSPWIGSRKSPKPNRCKYAFCPNCGADMRGEQE